MEDMHVAVSVLFRAPPPPSPLMRQHLQNCSVVGWLAMTCQDQQRPYSPIGETGVPHVNTNWPSVLTQWRGQIKGKYRKRNGVWASITSNLFIYAEDKCISFMSCNDLEINWSNWDHFHYYYYNYYYCFLLLFHVVQFALNLNQGF